MNKKISVIVPVYKSEQFINRCVDSIINQSYRNLEIILVNDGSPDRCGIICDELANKEKRIKVIHKENGGVSSARNAGLSVASGDFITFVDSDDYLEPDMYERMMKVAELYASDVVMCDCLKEYPDHTEPYSHDIRDGFYSAMDLKREYYPHLLIMENVEYPATISNWLCLFKRELCAAREAMDSLRYEVGVRFSEDLLFGARLLRRAKSFYYLKGVYLYHYCMNKQSASHVFKADKWEDYLLLHNRIQACFLNDEDYDFKHQIDLCLLFFVYNAVGDIMRADAVNHRDKEKMVKAILHELPVREMFKRLKIMQLPVSFKQRIITLCYKWEIGISLLIFYYD